MDTSLRHIGIAIVLLELAGHVYLELSEDSPADSMIRHTMLLFNLIICAIFFRLYQNSKKSKFFVPILVCGLCYLVSGHNTHPTLSSGELWTLFAGISAGLLL